MKMKPLLLACMALLPLAAEARLGETIAECDARYGKPYEVVPPGKIFRTDRWTRYYKFEGYDLTIFFINERSGMEMFSPLAKDKDGKHRIPDADGDVILLRNLGEKYATDPDVKSGDDSMKTVGWKSEIGRGVFRARRGMECRRRSRTR